MAYFITIFDRLYILLAIIVIAVYMLNFVILFDYLKKYKPKLLETLVFNLPFNVSEYWRLNPFKFWPYLFSNRKDDNNRTTIHKVIHLIFSGLLIILLVYFIIYKMPELI